jgi:hypothetical protein
MAFKIIGVNGGANSYLQKEYLLTNAEDVSKLPRIGIEGTQEICNDTVTNYPCAVGSTALVVTGAVTEAYILTPDNEWVKM